MGIFKSLFKPVKSVFKGIKNKILKPTERFLRKHKKTLLTAALITGLVFTGGALAGAGWASGFGSALGIGPAAAAGGGAGAFSATAPLTGGLGTTGATGAFTATAPLTTTGLTTAGGGALSTKAAITGGLSASKVGTIAAAPTATQLAGSTAAYGGATSLGIGEVSSLLAGTPDAPFRPGSPRFSRGGIGQRYDRPSMETLNFGIGGTTVNPYVS